jgi:transposase
MVEANGCKLEYLPPYSPDFNPIEFSFSVLKKVVKNQFQTQGYESPKQFAQLVVKAAMTAITPSIARNQFSHCKILVD